MTTTLSTSEILVTAIQSTIKYDPHHLDSFFNRERGSQWGRDLKIADLVSDKWKKLPRSEYVYPTHLNDCHYFYLDAESIKEMFPDARECVASSADMDPKDMQSLTAQHLDTGIRTNELVSDKIESRIPQEAWIIVGPASVQDPDGPNGRRTIHGEVMVWTLYPGRSFPRLPKDWDGDIKSLDLSVGYAVKGMAAALGGKS
jgi:hypothetical protein|tara:strand:+ start:80 stop:682 length:603 start_codon:yes stop_codon:yes gene_type:complete